MGTVFVLVYLVCFILYLYFGALIINGFFNVTRGNYKIMPDGDKVKEGQLLKDWYFFWFKENPEPKRCLYRGFEMIKVVNKWQNTKYPFTIEKYDSDKIVVSSLPDLKTILLVSESIDVTVTVQAGPTGIEVSFFKEEPSYVFPKEVRKMMAGCITCHSSWLGSIIYWLGVKFLFDANNSVPLILLTWAAYCISLAWLSPFLWKKIN